MVLFLNECQIKVVNVQGVTKAGIRLIPVLSDRDYINVFYINKKLCSIASCGNFAQQKKKS
jgi:hypothetical protein